MNETDTFSLNTPKNMALNWPLEHPQNSYVIGTNLMFKCNARAFILNSSGVTKFS